VDEEKLRSLVKQILTACGYNVLEAADGHHAINVWTENASNVQLLLTDIVMPNGVNGWALARTLQKRNPHLKVVYTSGYNPETALANGDGPEGSVNYIQKPYSPSKLVEFIRTCLDDKPAVAMHRVDDTQFILKNRMN
jgi:two-component system cell cycle sensor histidine kinase/response regulator CckA